MAWRVALGAAWIAILGLILFFDDRYGGRLSPLCLLLVVALTWRGAYELALMLRTRYRGLAVRGVCALCLLVVGSHWIGQVPIAAELNAGPMLWPMVALAVAMIVLFMSHARRFRSGRSVLDVLAAEVFAVVYVGGLLSFAVALRWIPIGPSGGKLSLLPLLSLLFTTKGTDTAAYCAGKLFGRHALAAQLSPRKTVEGAIGGLVGALTIAGLLFHVVPWAAGWTLPAVSPFWSVGFALAVSVAGQAGDLAESLLKRDIGQKDSATLMPGLGGVLDLMDSILFAGPVAFVFWSFY